MRQTAERLPSHSAPRRRARAIAGLAAGVKAAPSLVLGLALALAALPARGIDWSFKAFGTMAGIGTDTDKLGFRRDFTQDTYATRAWVGDIDSRVGLQVDADFNPEFHATVQWVARNHAGDVFWQNLEWAFVRWRPREDFEVRVGRTAFDGFLMSEYRNVGYAYLWMRPPAEFYGLISNYNNDGLGIAKKFRLDDGTLTLRGYGGYSYQATAFNIDVDVLLFGGNVVYESGDWLLRLGYIQEKQLDHGFIKMGWLDNPVGAAVWPAIQPLVQEWASVNKLLHYTTLGLSYDDGTWPVQAELAYIDSNWLEFPSIFSGYLSVGRRVGKLTPYLLFGVAESLNNHTPVPAPLARAPRLLGAQIAFDQYLNFKGVDQMSASTGVRWDVHENIALKAQWSHFWLGANGTLLWPKLDGLNEPTNVNVWSFGVDFVY